MAYWKWRTGNGVLEMAYWKWRTGNGVLEMAYWKWRTGNGVLEMAYWKWRTGNGVLEMAYWKWRTGNGVLEMAYQEHRHFFQKIGGPHHDGKAMKANRLSRAKAEKKRAILSKWDTIARVSRSHCTCMSGYNHM